jgi:hypothetical protein
MHFTYDENLEKTCLLQGDVLRRTEQINQILKDFHPHYYQNDDNHFLIVLTQSCDLERRDQEFCKARYITLAAVRPARLAIEREINNHRSPLEAQAHVARKSLEVVIERFVQHLLNNNQSPYFYLHEDVAAGLAEPECAFLRLSIPIKSRLHYETCLAAKFLQLKPEFQAKLGWLVGDLYSRIATAEWTPNPEFKSRVSKILNDQIIWVEAKQHKQLMAVLAQCQEPVTLDVAVRELERIQVPTRKQSVIRRMRELLEPVAMDHPTRVKLYNQLENDENLTAFLS